MFTGLIQALGVIRTLTPTQGGLLLSVLPKHWHTPATPHSPAPALGDSISVDGCCLTVAKPPRPAPPGKDRLLTFILVPQTLSKTTFLSRAVGDTVNLERACRADSLLGGHIVQGHVDTTATVVRIDTDGQWRVRFRLAERSPHLIPQGSIAVSGVSLTIADVGKDARTFSVALIPTTLELTNLSRLRVGDRVNIETDALSKLVARHVEHFWKSRPNPTNSSLPRK